MSPNMSEFAETGMAPLRRLLQKLGTVAIAVSGGVDSMTLAILAGRTLGHQVTMVHAVSPAVPAEATARVQRIAALEHWRLRLIETGEFADESYLSNPYDRCYHCKRHLYRRVATTATGILLSGTNLDDLDDYRPGLQAAREHGVRHPFVECGIDKAGLRRICRALGYSDLAELPASPCLSSRVETGFRIDAAVLAFVYRTERALRQELDSDVVRCRVRHDRIAVELDELSFAALPAAARADWQRRIGTSAVAAGLPAAVTVEAYRRGGAFVASADQQVNECPAENPVTGSVSAGGRRAERPPRSR